MSKLSEEELSVLVEYAFGEAMCVQERKVEPRDLNQAYEQIKEMIQKPGVTEEWFDEKAREVLDILYKNLFYGRDYADRMEKIKGFFRSLVEEIK